MARAASVIAAARAEVPATLVFDNGDFLEGAAIADPYEGGAGVGADNPVVAAMNALGYDAIGLGNHEFNMPAEDVQAALKALRSPVLCANLHLSRDRDASVYADLWCCLAKSQISAAIYMSCKLACFRFCRHRW